MKILLLSLFCLFVSSANATTIFSISQTVTSADRSATFDTLTANNIDLNNYIEDSLSFTVNDFTYQGFTAFYPNDSRTTGFYYGWGGNNGYVSISGTDNALFTAFDFLLGNGNPDDFTNIRWETYLNGALSSSGIESGIAKGQIVGWSDVNGFDELRVAASSYEASPGFGNLQSIAIDDFRAAVSPVPAPATVSLFGLGLGLVGLIAMRKKRIEVS